MWQPVTLGDLQSQSQSQSYFTTGGLQPISSSWRQVSWSSREEIFFFNWTLAVADLDVTSLMRRWICLLWICLAFCQVYVSYIQHVIENSSFCTIYKSSISTGFAKQIMPILRILCYNGSVVILTVVSLNTVNFKPLMFSMSGFTLFYTADMFILMILYDFCLLPAQFYYIIIYIRKIGSRVEIADRCAPWRISNGPDSLVL
jgi:hypothetical protein